MSNKLTKADLRIGNIVYNPNLKEIRVLDILDIRDFAEGRLLFPFEPIPLTEEWLLKFGFEFRNTDKQYGWFLVVSKNRFLTWCHSKEVSLEFGLEDYGYNNTLFDFHCEYVHQLQNLYFTLTNQELTTND